MPSLYACAESNQSQAADASNRYVAAFHGLLRRTPDHCAQCLAGYASAGAKRRARKLRRRPNCGGPRDPLHNSLRSVVARARAHRCVVFLANSGAIGCKKTPCGPSRSAYHSSARVMQRVPSRLVLWNFAGWITLSRCGLHTALPQKAESVLHRVAVDNTRLRPIKAVAGSNHASRKTRH